MGVCMCYQHHHRICHKRRSTTTILIVVNSSTMAAKTLFLSVCFLFFSIGGGSPPLDNSSLPDPESVVLELQNKVEGSRRRALSSSTWCLTGNPIDDCWRCEANWANNRQRLADCGIGFGRDALGGKGGRIYVVSDNSDSDPANPSPGTLRYGVIQEEPLWIIFSTSTIIRLKEELIVNSFKTIDGRGADVYITGVGCITLQYVSNVIIHNVHIHHCVPGGNANVRSTPTHVGHRGRSDGDGISIFSSRKLWIDHCSLSHCTDGLIDAIMGSTAITISNNHFSHHDEVMLLGHNDDYLPDSGMQVTIAFNHFGEALVQRMPRVRHGYVHVVNNDFTRWEMYVIGGSAGPTVNSQGNRYTAPGDKYAKQVTKRVGTDEEVWASWNWRTEGDLMLNGAFFVPSGAVVETKYARARSVRPESAAMIDQLTVNAGVLGSSSRVAGRGGGGTTSLGGSSHGGGGGGGGGYFGMIYGSGRGSRSGGGYSSSASHTMRPPTMLSCCFASASLLFLHARLLRLGADLLGPSVHRMAQPFCNT